MPDALNSEVPVHLADQIGGQLFLHRDDYGWAITVADADTLQNVGDGDMATINLEPAQLEDLGRALLKAAKSGG